jgi:hypothetical protein
MVEEHLVMEARVEEVQDGVLDRRRRTGSTGSHFLCLCGVERLPCRSFGLR